VKTVSVAYVQGRWGYSEITSPRFAKFYNGSDAPELRKKRNAGVLFELLSPDECYSLAFQCVWVRQCFAPYFVGITEYEEVLLARKELADLWVPPMVWGESAGSIISFRHYMGPKTDAPDDPRNVAQVPEYSAPSDPLTIGRAYGASYLLDGYHRAAQFWKQPRIHAGIPAYRPL
jgi:hypothetical protein